MATSCNIHPSNDLLFLPLEPDPCFDVFYSTAYPLSLLLVHDMNATTTNNSISHPSIPTSALGPATITIIVALVLITCCILHCHRVQYTVRSRRWIKSPSTVVTQNTPLPTSHNHSHSHFTLQHDEKQQDILQQPQPAIIKPSG